jgi:pyruvate/2-oxoglutarate dehydrogenase complex dihydrolipoamide dehydrogenase (E3) component
LKLDVSLVEFTPHVMPAADAEMAEPIHDELRRHGIHLLLNSRVSSIEPPAMKQLDIVSTLMVNTSEGDRVYADIILMCVGLKARTSLAAAAGLEIGSSGVSVNDFMQTSDPSIYAVGDMFETENVTSLEWMTLMLAGPANR